MTNEKFAKNIFTDAVGAIDDRYLLEALDIPAKRRKPHRLWVLAALVGLAACLVGFRMLSYLFL